MASAVVGFYQVFGIDEPANNYSDIEKCNTMVLWGNNMAEAHPVLWSRVADRKLTHKETKIINLTTYKNMSSNMADETIIFAPNGDLAILNYILREIVHRDAIDHDFVNKHCIFAAGGMDIGYGMRPTDKFAFPKEKDIQAKQNAIILSKEEAIAQSRPELAGKEVKQTQQGGKAGAHWSISFEDFKKGVEPTPWTSRHKSLRATLTKAWKTSRRNLRTLLTSTSTRRTTSSASGAWALTSIREAFGSMN